MGKSVKRGCETCSREHTCVDGRVKRFRKNCKYFNPDVTTSCWEYKGDKPETYFEAKMKQINRDRMMENS